MASVFTKIIAGEIPGRFVWKDDKCVAFLTIEAITNGHTLVVPRAEIDHWIDLPPDLAAHLFVVSQNIGKAIQKAFRAPRIGVIIAGMDVPHTHIHVIGIADTGDLTFANARSPRGDVLDHAADKLRLALKELRYPQVSD